MKIIVFILFTAVIVSCNRSECINTNPVFNNNLPESKIYKDELLNQLLKSDNNEITYWLESYEERDNKTYLCFHVQSDSLCAEAVIWIKEWDEKLADIKRTKGNGYIGAEFKGLTFGVETTPDHTELIYSGVNIITD